MIQSFTLLRALALLKRLTRAAESIAASQSRLATTQEQAHPPRRKPRHTQFGTLDIAEVNKRWHAQQEVDRLNQAFPEEWQEP